MDRYFPGRYFDSRAVVMCVFGHEQAICMFGSFLAIIIKGNYDAGGSSEVFDRNYRTNRIELFNFEPDMRRRHTIWGLVIGGFFTWISIYGINQTQVQRYLTVKKRSQAVK